MDFYDQIMQSIAEESKDNGKYAQLAEIAPTEKAKRILLDMAKEEERHKEYLQEILSENKSHDQKAYVPAANEQGNRPDANSEINVPDNGTIT